jgi:hypothetical protein
MGWAGHSIYEIRNSLQITEDLNNQDHFRPMYRWKYNIKMDINEMQFKGDDQIHLSRLKVGLMVKVDAFQTLVAILQAIQHPTEDDHNLEQAGVGVMFWTHILDVLGSYPSRDTGCFNKFLMVLL